MNPRFDEIIDDYTDYHGDRTVPRVNPTKVYATVGKRDHMHFDNSEASISMPSLIIYDTLRSISGTYRGRKSIAELQTESGGAPAPRAREPTPSPSGGESDHDARGAGPLPREDVEQALMSSAADEHEASKLVTCKATEEEKASPFDDIASDEGDRPIIRRMAPQGLGLFEESPPCGAREVPNEALSGSGLRQSHFPQGR